MADEDDFLSRWSRRKLKPDVEGTASKPTEPAPAEQEPDTPEAESELLAKLNLPVPETLKDGDDFSAFMKAGVPEFLKKRALRVLWRSNPVLANLDGLNDYDEDFTSPELTQKVLATAYKVGRGILSQKVDDEAPETPDMPPDEPSTQALETPEQPVAPTENSDTPESAAYDEPDTPPVRPRRMRFET